MRTRLALAFCLVSAIAHAAGWGVATQVSTTSIVPSITDLKAVLGPEDPVRDVLGWAKVEKAKGQYVMPPQFAQFYANVVAAGGKNVVTLAFGNRLYTTNQDGKPSDMALPTTPEALSAFAAYAAWVAKNVPGIIAVSIWNECNGSFCSGTPTERQANYIAVLKATVPAIRAANPTVKIIAGATVGINIDGWFINISKLFDWKQVDYLDIHPYVGDVRPTTLPTFQAQMKHIRDAGITDPAFYSEWGGTNAVNMGPTYPAWFKKNVIPLDTVAPAGSTFFTLYGQYGLIGNDGILNPMGQAFVAAR